MNNITGPPAEDGDFFDRKEEFSRLTKAIIDGNHVLLSAPRRVGKSSLLKKVVKWAKIERNWRSIEVDVQNCRDEAAFLDEIIEALKAANIELKHLEQLISQVTKLRDRLGIKKLPGGVEMCGTVPINWMEPASALEKVFDELAGGNQITLIGMDELPIFLSRLQQEECGTQRVGLVLSWLRQIQQKHAKEIRWIICGSIGLDTFVEQHNLVGTINHLQIQRLGAFSPDVAKLFLKELGKENLELSEEVIDHILDKIGWHLPYYLQVLYHSICEIPAHKRSANHPSIADVDAAWEELLGPNFSSYFSHWETRLADQFDAVKAKNARNLLKRICVHKSGLSRAKLFELLVQKAPQSDPDDLDELLSTLLNALERDGYLERKNTIYAFRSPLLRDFWKRHHH